MTNKDKKILIQDLLEKQIKFLLFNVYKYQFTFKSVDNEYQIVIGLSEEDDLEIMYRWYIQANVEYVLIDSNYSTNLIENIDWLDINFILSIEKI